MLTADDKRLHLFHVLLRDGEAGPVATAEQMLLHVAAATGRVAAADSAVQARIEALRAEHAVLPRPEHAGRVGVR